MSEAKLRFLILQIQRGRITLDDLDGLPDLAAQYKAAAALILAKKR